MFAIIHMAHQPNSGTSEFWFNANSGSLTMQGGGKWTELRGVAATLRQVRDDRGDDEIGGKLPAHINCLVHEFPGHGLYCVVVSVSQLGAAALVTAME